MSHFGVFLGKGLPGTHHPLFDLAISLNRLINILLLPLLVLSRLHLSRAVTAVSAP